MDLRKELKYLYEPSAKKPVLVDVPEFQFAMIDGGIEPGQEPSTSPEFQQAIEALYGITYTLKFTSKLRKDNPIDYPVMALEGLWWAEDGEFVISEPGHWRWTVMIMQPDHITPEMFADGIAQVRKKRGDSPGLARLRLERFGEGLAVQIMHIGPYSQEPATLAKLHNFAVEQGYSLHGKHHEIYLGDPRRAAPEKLKTVLRRPVQKNA